MATITDGETNGYAFLWNIENISHCWLKKGERIESPTFIASTLEGTKWSLRLYPMGHTDENYVGLYIRRGRDCSETNIIEVNFQLAFLNKDGSYLRQLTKKQSFKKDMGCGNCLFHPREKVFVSEREVFLPEDTLAVQCKIWRKEDTLVNPEYLNARTVFKVNKRRFVWKIDKFSSHKTDVRDKFKDDLIEFDLYLNETHFAKKLDLDIISFNESVKYFSFKTSIINADGGKESCGTHEYIADEIKKEVLSTPLFNAMVMENKTRYLPNDTLVLDCEYASSNGAVSYEFCGRISSKVTNMVVEKTLKHRVRKDKSLSTSAMAKDFKSMYNDGIFSDTELRTSTQTFPVHKSILSARSPVFRRMFSSDMKEKNSGHVDISDLEDDTVHRMLIYIYTDSLEDLQFENACKLYIASDKYEILSLRNTCSSFLKGNLSPTNACDALVLAELLQDDDLKSDVTDYILKHDQEVFGSQEWKCVMVTNCQLAADIMYRKVFPG